MRTAKAVSFAGRGIAVLLSLVLAQGLRASGQIADGGRFSSLTAYGTVGGENTQLPNFSDNALGFDLGVSYQPRDLVGAEFRAGAYPYSARYMQMGMTGGYRVTKESFLGFPYAPFLYFGGGMARSVDKAFGYARLPATWDRCWQADLGFDRDYGRFAWRVAQISWRETYTPLHSLHSFGLSTGIVYHFQR